MDLSTIIPRKYYQMGNLHFEYIREEKYMYLHETKGESTRFLYKTPMLKVFKNIHEFNNDYYLILNLDNEDDINHEIYNFKSRMDRIYGKAQDEVKKNYKEIFPNLKGYVDQVTYETCVKRPYTGSRGQLMKILVEEGNEEMFHKLEKLVEGDHVQCTIWYKGLRKVSGGRMIEEYVLVDFVTEDEWMSEVTKKMIHPYQTKYDVEVIQEENPTVFQEENVKLSEEDKPIEEEKTEIQVEDDIEVVSILEEPVIERIEDEKIKKPRKSKKNSTKETKQSSRKKREEWVKSKKGHYDSEEEKGELSDQEEFQELTEEEKDKFRKLYKQMKHKS